MVIPGTDLDVFPICLGAGDLGTRIRDEEVDRLLDAYAEAGGNFLDTAHVYGSWVTNEAGASERALGSWMRSRKCRSEVRVSTKGGHPPVSFYPHDEDFLSPQAIKKDVAESLDRLETDWIDLYYLHRDDGKTPVAEIIDCLNSIPSLRFIGASNWSLDRVEEANRYAKQTGQRGFVCLQSQWSLAIPVWKATEDPTVRYVTDEDAARCKANGITIHPYSATANGYFSSLDDTGAFTGNAEIRERTKQLAGEMGKTPTQIALAWLMSQPQSVVPIVGTTKEAHLEEAIGAIGIALDQEGQRVWLRGH